MSLTGSPARPQSRMLAVLDDVGRARLVLVARALGLEAPAVTRLADRTVSRGLMPV
jgi:hypothetical protein